MSRQILTGLTNQTTGANVYCEFQGVRYTATIDSGVWTIIIPRKVMDQHPATVSFTVTIKNDAGSRIHLVRDAVLKPPEAPGNFVVTQTSPTSVRLTWDRPEDRDRLVGYQVLHNGKQIQLSTDTSVDVVGLKVGVKQVFQLRSKNNLGTYSIPRTITKTITANQAPKVTVTSQTTGTITDDSYILTWDDVAPQQWETWVRVWDENERKPISNTKYARGITAAVVTGYTGKVSIEIVNVPENTAGIGPDYANPIRHGKQVFTLVVSE